ncbi:MAG: 2-phospho-L-lactate transferase [Gammaproteobacteria bacterium]|nr:2-phospho-L-lactate transferase [Gammaproteobacteria bacterium]
MRLIALTGGIGGAKLALGFAKLLTPDEVSFVVNTGDDFEHLGFHISPDVDTLTYTLAEEANPETGWGRRDETWHFMETLERFGGETWFRLGDRDLALHAFRRTRLDAGATLTQVTRELCGKLGIAHDVWPMSDDPVRTRVRTSDGFLAFQHYFVRDRCAPAVTGFEFAGIDAAAVNPELVAALREPVRAVVICPSNPFVSVDPILDIPGMRDLLRGAGAPVIAVSPIIGGQAIKGPTAKMMRELSIPATTEQVAAHYAGLITAFVLDEQDASAQPAVEAMDLDTIVAQTVMGTLQDRVDLARTVLDFTDRLRAALRPTAN